MPELLRLAAAYSTAGGRAVVGADNGPKRANCERFQLDQAADVRPVATSARRL